METLVSTEWLAGHLADPDLVIVDASYHLTPRDPAAEFAAAHIPGAVFLNLKALADPDHPAPMMLPRPDAFAAAMGALGIGEGRRVVLYDDSDIRTAARAWWMLRTMGFADVAILDGGLAKWRAEGRPLEAGEHRPCPATFSPRPASGAVRDKAAMLANVTSGEEQVVDARGAPRFSGAEADPRPGVAAGHIPGALNLPYGRMFQADGTWKSPDAIRAEFDAAGIDLDRPIVASCGSGITASVLLFGLDRIGQGGALYDGSWSEWGIDPETPKEVTA
ncbi:3-mercaptopyruvate sulfurtransferase [Sphingomonas sp. FW199]|uniref:3-mercaptopyruvate sulfurtransferase n=1 Tax=Sphingomonas sp. FW199 TaxID=3400217 RepID=UPI003CEA93A1